MKTFHCPLPFFEGLLEVSYSDEILKFLILRVLGALPFSFFFPFCSYTKILFIGYFKKKKKKKRKILSSDWKCGISPAIDHLFFCYCCDVTSE